MVSLVLTIFSIVVASASATIDLPFSVVMSSTMDPLYGVALESTVPAIDQALDYINNNSSLLPGYNLQYVAILRSECSRRHAFDVMFREILKGPSLAIVSCACAEVSLAIADVINYWNIPQLACNPLSREGLCLPGSNYSHLFQLHPNPETYAGAVALFVQQFQWQRLTIISQEGEIFDEVKNLLCNSLLPQANVSVIEPQLLGNLSSDEDTENLFPQDVRVFFLNMNNSNARDVLCKAYKVGKRFPGYAWLTYSDETGAFARQHEAHCETDSFLRGVFAIRSTSTPGLTTIEPETTHSNSMSSSGTALAKFAYDSVITLATLLNKTIEIVESGEDKESLTTCGNLTGSLEPPENFTYENNFMGCLFLEVLRNANLTGLTDHISFNSQGERLTRSVTLFQYRSTEEGQSRPVPVAEINTNTQEFTYEQNESNSRLFEGAVPPDGTPIKQVNAQPLPLVVIYYFIAALGLAFTLVCFLFNVVFRKRKIVKLTSPNLNYFITAGAVLLYGSIYIRVYLDSSELYNNIRCNLQAAMNTIGYVLVFAPILVKMWRVYYIFHNPLPNKKAVKDWHLTLAVVAMLAVIVIAVLLSFVVPQLRPDLVLKPDVERPQGLTEDGVTIEFCAWECYDSLLPFIWVALEFVYLISLQVAAIILAFKTRKVKIKELNDSKYVAAIIYITSMVIVALIVITFALDSYIIVAEALFSGGLILATTVFLALIFVPKMIALSRDPEGEGVFKSTGMGTTALDSVPTTTLAHDTSQQGSSNGHQVLSLNGHTPTAAARATVSLNHDEEEAENRNGCGVRDK